MTFSPESLPNAPAVWRGPMVSKAVKQFARIAREVAGSLGYQHVAAAEAQ